MRSTRAVFDMFRVLWRFPLYGSDPNGGGGGPVTPAFGESWAFPVNAIGQRVPPNQSHDPVDWVESGHKRTP